MQVKDVMTKEVITVNSETSIIEAARLMSEKRIHGLPVMENGKVVGIIAETDFFTKNIEDIHIPSFIKFLEKSRTTSAMTHNQSQKVKDLLKTKVKDIMTANCRTLSPEMDMERAIQEFKENKLNTFPVVNANNELIGIISLTDIINLI